MMSCRLVRQSSSEDFSNGIQFLELDPMFLYSMSLSLTIQSFPPTFRMFMLGPKPAKRSLIFIDRSNDHSDPHLINIRNKIKFLFKQILDKWPL